MDVAKWQSSPVYITVRDIVSGPDVSYKSRLSAILHTTTQDYPIFKILSEDFVRDYLLMMMDTVQIKVMIPMGDYAYLIYPNKDNLELTVTKTYLQSIGDSEDADKQIEQVRYKCILDTKSPSFTTNDLGNFSQQSMNSTQILTIKFQLMDRNAEPLRVKMVQGIFRGITAKDLITSVLLGEAQNIQVDGAPVVSGLDLVPPDNTAPFNQVILSSGTHICEVPNILQQKYGGIYKYGLGVYYQRYNNNTPTWFVYPLYDFDRFDGGREQNVAIFYFAPPKFTKNIERTYRVNGSLLEAVITTDKIQVNTTDVTQLNDGVGFRMLDPNAMMKKPIEVDDTGAAIGSRARLNREVGYIDRGDGLNYTPVVRDISSNPYHEISKVSARQATVIHFAWENSDESLLYPGMPCKCVYMQNDIICEVKATLLNVHATRNRQGTLGEPDRYATKCIIAVATELNIQLPDYDSDQSFSPGSN